MAIPVLMPALSPSMEKGMLTRWIRRAGDFVEAGDLIAEVATDRATMDVESPSTGVLSLILVAAGAIDVPVHDHIALIEPQVAPPPPLPPRERKTASPRARRLARESGIDLAGLNGGGPNGRVIERDVRAALAAEGRETPVLAQARAEPAMEARPSPLGAGALACLEIDCEMDALLELLRRLNEAVALQAANAAPIALDDAIVKALAMALRRASALPGDVAIEAEGARALVRGAETLTLAQLAAARQQPHPQTMEAAACLVVNLGGSGVKRFSAPPDKSCSSLLAVGAVAKRMIVKQETPEMATMMSVTLTLDDARVGAKILSALKWLIENPYVMLL